MTVLPFVTEYYIIVVAESTSHVPIISTSVVFVFSMKTGTLPCTIILEVIFSVIVIWTI